MDKVETSSLKVGLGFGLASGVITTLGLMIGIYASTLSRGNVIGGILTIAIADAFSDAVGIHFSKESEGCSTYEIWLSTIITFFSKFFVALSFVVAVLFLPLKIGIITNIAWSYLLVGTFSFVISRMRKESSIKAISEHFFIMTIVIILTYYVGVGIETVFNNSNG